MDLRGLEDFDIGDLRRKQEQQRLTVTTTVPASVLRSLLECAANADDTTKLQERCIRDVLAPMR